jgi:hypothetical protein
MDTRKNHLSDRVHVYAVIWIVCYVGTIFALKSLTIPIEAGVMLTIVTALSFSVFVYKYYRSIFFMDEVQIRIQMEAIVIAFSLGLLLTMTLGLLDLFINLSKEDWSYRFMVPMLIVFYFIGFLISKRKYKFENEKHD